MTEQGTEAARLQVDTYYSQDKVLVVYLPECHESLAGIIAGRLREHYQKPSIVLTKGEEAVKGSGRSIESYHMFQKLSEVKKISGNSEGSSMKGPDLGRKILRPRSGLTCRCR